jgi:cytosine/creatinine deaminase
VSGYWLRNARVHGSLLGQAPAGVVTSRDGFALVDVEIVADRIATVQPAPGSGSGLTETERGTDRPPARRAAETAPPGDLDLRGGQVWPCFVDLHAHLDKGHVWARSPNPDGTRPGALAAVSSDREQHWSNSDIRRRMEFGLRCAYAHGTRAMRTHLDSHWSRPDVSWTVAEEAREAWKNRIALQLSALVPLDVYAGRHGEELADRVARARGILGAVVGTMPPDLDTLLDRVFALATARDLEVDLHCDESSDAALFALPRVASAVLRAGFSGRVVCGHCCTLALQSPAAIDEALDLVQRAGIAVVSLPLCNLYLQDRHRGRTPRWRGVTLVHELAARGIAVAVASDNCRDPFFGFGDHDMLEVFREGVRVEHLDRPYADWPRAVTTTPARVMRLPSIGTVSAGEPADLVLFPAARDFSELLSRPQADRRVLRRGVAIDTTLPDYRELDDLMGSG